MKVRDSYINDDLADEVEAIRLAADFTSRRLMSEQKRDRRDSVAVSAASASRLRIRSLLDKQKTVRVRTEMGFIYFEQLAKMTSLQEDEESQLLQQQQQQQQPPLPEELSAQRPDEV